MQGIDNRTWVCTGIRSIGGNKTLVTFENLDKSQIQILGKHGDISKFSHLAVYDFKIKEGRDD